VWFSGKVNSSGRAEGVAECWQYDALRKEVQSPNGTFRAYCRQPFCYLTGKDCPPSTQNPEDWTIFRFELVVLLVPQTASILIGFFQLGECILWRIRRSALVDR
jgi:hypothetical protein